MQTKLLKGLKAVVGKSESSSESETSPKKHEVTFRDVFNAANNVRHYLATQGKLELDEHRTILGLHYDIFDGSPYVECVLNASKTYVTVPLASLLMLDVHREKLLSDIITPE